MQKVVGRPGELHLYASSICMHPPRELFGLSTPSHRRCCLSSTFFVARAAADTALVTPAVGCGCLQLGGVAPQTSVRRPRPPSSLAIAPTLHGRPVKRFHSTTPTRASPARNLHYRPDKLFGRSTHRTNRAATAGSACRRLAKQGTHIICTSARYAARDPASTAEEGCRAVEADGPR